MLPKRGIVVAVYPDGHVYGKMEATSPLFRIVKLPGDTTFGAAMLGPQIATVPQSTAPLLARAFLLDLDDASIAAGDPALRAYLDDTARASPAFTADNVALVEALKRTRATPESNVIG